MSRSAYAHPSRTARATCAEVWFIARPRNAPRIASFHRGAVEPDSAGRNSTPSLAGGASAARVKISPCGTPSRLASHSVLPPLTNPGFSISHEPGTAWPCVSTTPSGSRTGSAATVVTGSAVPVTSTTTPDSMAPAPTDAACSSPVPTTTAHVDGSPRSAATSGRRVPTTSVEGRTAGSMAESRPAASHSSLSKSPLATSYTIVDDALAASWAWSPKGDAAHMNRQERALPPLPDLRLVLPDPHHLRRAVRRIRHQSGALGEQIGTHRRDQLVALFGGPLVKPDDRRAQRVPSASHATTPSTWLPRPIATTRSACTPSTAARTASRSAVQ